MNSVIYIGYIRYMNGHIDIKYIRIEYLDMDTVAHWISRFKYGIKITDMKPVGGQSVCP
jgi:hypothetical protein